MQKSGLPGKNPDFQKKNLIHRFGNVKEIILSFRVQTFQKAKIQDSDKKKLIIEAIKIRGYRDHVTEQSDKTQMSNSPDVAVRNFELKFSILLPRV